MMKSDLYSPASAKLSELGFTLTLNHQFANTSTGSQVDVFKNYGKYGKKLMCPKTYGKYSFSFFES